jgi:hypothetical protein
MKANVSSAADAEILPILVTPVTQVRKAALPHLDSVSVWKIKDFQNWTKEAVTVVREIRTSLTVSGDLVWRANAITILKKHKFDAVSLLSMLRTQKAADALKSV